MVELYLTPASISYLTQFLLSALIMTYLGARVFVFKEQRSDIPVKLMIALFGGVSFFSALLFFEASTLPGDQLLFLYLENAALGVILILLLQFAYHYPRPLDSQKLERRFALALTLGYALMEAGYAVWRLRLWLSGEALFRYEFMDIPLVAALLWIIFVFVRNSLRNVEGGSRKFASVFVVPLFLVILNILISFVVEIPVSFYHLSMSVGILFSLWYFVRTYLASQPELFSFSARLAGSLLTGALAVLGSIAWLATPVYAETFRPDLLDRRTLKFTPNDGGGYTVTEAPFFFDTNFGQALPLGEPAHTPSAKVDFEFMFFGQRYHEIHVSTYGALGIGSELDFRDYAIGFTQTPAIMPLLLALAPNERQGAVYWRTDGEQLLITFDRVRSYHQSDKRYTFQVRLHSDGNFTITYNGLPTVMEYHANDRPEASVWALGIKPSQAPGEQSDFTNLPIVGGNEGLIQNYQLAFRQDLHRFILPLAISVCVVSFILLLGTPIILNYNLTRPLRALVNGVEQINRGQLGATLPVQFNDEIGYLTRSFNHLSTELNSLVHGLETRVANRTSDLLALNEQLLKLSVVVEQSPSSIVITDTLANIEYVNPAFTLATGYSFEEVKGKNPRILKSGLTPPEVYQEMWRQLSVGNSWRGELVNKKKDGTIFWESTVIAPIYDTVTGAISHYAAIKEDVTARVKAEQALRDSEEQYRLLFDLETDAIFIIRNEDGHILNVNRAATSMYGYSLEEMLTKKNTDLSAEPESTRKATNTPFPIDQVVTIPLRYHRKKDGVVFPVEITARFITWKGQSVHIAAMRDITERKMIEEELVKLSVTDPLTDIANRRYFYIQAEAIFNRVQYPDTLVVLMLDVDYFKRVNDQFGHATGDKILRQFAARLKANLRPTDILARYGGEEFAILLPRTSLHEAGYIVKRLWEVIKDTPFDVDSESVHVTVSIGVAGLSSAAEDLDTLMRLADEALYHAKQTGRNRWVIWGAAGRIKLP